MYDIIGDIHGHADELKRLLTKLGYDEKNGIYKHSNRKAIFVGDFIDRGPKIREVLRIVKNMTDNETALAVMGNHEFNALCYNTQRSDGRYLREHNSKNINQTRQTTGQFEKYPDEWNNFLEWFTRLPLMLELDGLRVVHACWDDLNIKNIRANNPKMDRESLLDLFELSNKDLLKSIDETLKGKECELPLSFKDKDGFERSEWRIKWWKDPHHIPLSEYFFGMDNLSDIDKLCRGALIHDHYRQDEPPVFCGHYWLTNKQPELLSSNVACVDYSVAKNNILCAYQWKGEKVLSQENFVWV